MKMIFEDVNDLDRRRLLRASNGILKSLYVITEAKRLSRECGVNPDDQKDMPTDDEIKDALCINQAIINFLKEDKGL